VSSKAQSEAVDCFSLLGIRHLAPGEKKKTQRSWDQTRYVIRLPLVQQKKKKASSTQHPHLQNIFKTRTAHRWEQRYRACRVCPIPVVAISGTSSLEWLSPSPPSPPPHPTLPVFQMLLRLMNGAFSFSHAQARSLHRVRACVRLAIFRVSHCHWVCTQGLVRWFTRDAVKDETPNSLRQTVQKEEEERLLCLSKDTRSIRRQLKRF